MSNPGSVVRNPMNILTQDQLQRIHSGALDTLENRGIVFQHERALTILEAAGCRVDRDEKLVRFPSHIVEKCLNQCPSSFTLKGRDPRYDLRLGDPLVYWGSWAGKNYIDLETLETREPTEQETMDAWRVLDYLDGVHYAGYAYGSMQAPGHLKKYAESPWGYCYHYALVARNTGKAGSAWIGGAGGGHKWCIKISRATGVTPIGSPAASPPLTYYKDAVDIILDCAEAGIPLKPVSGVTAGANAPATLAGTLVQNCAEVMACVVLAQIVSPGIGIIAQDYSQMLDMRTGIIIQGGIERGLLGAAWCQIWRNYGIPRMTMISSDAKIPDYQCAMEKVMSVTLHALAGSNIICFMGGIYDELLFSPIVAIMDNDVAHMVERMLKGITVNSQTLAVDLIKEVGPIPGQFLDTKHTRETWKNEQFIPELADRLSHPEWKKRGRKDMVTRAKEKYEEIKNTHEPSPLSEEQDREIDRLLEESRRCYFPD
jgi:trimethylamine--corrinoid protein Co-methyltransferase